MAKKKVLADGDQTSTSKNQVVNDNTTKEPKSQGHGGKREGAGRKKKDTVRECALLLHNTIYHTDLEELTDIQYKHLKPLAQTKMAKNYWAVLYEDSEYTPENWREIVQGWLLPGHMILHDLCKNPDDTDKKDHWHILIKFADPTVPLIAAEMFAEVGAIIENKPIKSLQGACRYLIHRDNPEKTQYPMDNVISFNGASYLLDIESNVDNLEIAKEIQRFVFSHRGVIRCYADLSLYASEYNTVWYNYIVHNAYHLSAIFKSLKYSEYQTAEQIQQKINDMEDNDNDSKVNFRD